MSLTTEQLAARKIGGSDVATILGLNPWKTAEELRLEILGRLTPAPGNDATDVGEIMEDGIRQLYARRTGRNVNRSHQTLVHPKHSWLTAHIDGRVVGEKRGLECKNVHWRMASRWGEPGSDEIAEYYLPQVMHYMLVLDYPVWDVAAYFGGPDLRIYTVERDSDWDEIIIDSTYDFWHVNVLKDVACHIDATRPDALRALRRIYPGTDGTILPITPELMHWHEILQDASKLASQYEKIAEGAKAHMLREMGEAAILDVPGEGSYTRKHINRKGYSVEPTEYMDFRFRSRKDKSYE
jgi:putative phage-type endonuclease